MTTATNQLKIALAQPRIRAAISAHARSNPERDPIKRVHQAVSSVAPHLADEAALHAQAAIGIRFRPGEQKAIPGGGQISGSNTSAGGPGINPGGGTGGAPVFKAHPSILAHARQAPDGHHYVPDPRRPGKFARVVTNGNSVQSSGYNVQGSSGVEQTAVNRQVAGSSPAPGANNLSLAGAAVNPALAAAGGSPANNMREVELIRHGSTDLNSEDTSVDVIRGHKDVPLNAEGKSEALRTGQVIAKSPHKPDVLVSSDLCRAKLTAQIISQAANIPVSWISEHFRPWDAGQLTGQPSKKAVPIMGQYAEQRPDEPLPGGESFHTFLGRLFIGIDAALAKHPNQRVGIVSHHRDERALHAWRAKGFPVDGSIDHKVFSQKGEKPGGSQTFQLPVDRVRAVAQRYQNAAMAPTPDRPEDEQPGQE